MFKHLHAVRTDGFIDRIVYTVTHPAAADLVAQFEKGRVG